MIMVLFAMCIWPMFILKETRVEDVCRFEFKKAGNM
jgi:hypothetical protein